MASCTAKLTFGVVFFLGMLGGHDSLYAREMDRLQLSCQGDVVAWELSKSALAGVRIVEKLESSIWFICVGSFASTTGKCPDDVEIDHSYGKYMIISSVSMEDAGRYKCIKNGGDDEEIDVIVIQRFSPVLKFRSKTSRPAKDFYDIQPSESISLSCSVVYSGMERPNLQMIHTTTVNEYVLVASLESATGVYKSRESLSISSVYYASEYPNEFDISCVVPGLPNNLETKNSLNFRVLSGPTFYDDLFEENIDANNGFAHLICEADSYPAPVYTWQYKRRYSVETLDWNSSRYIAENPGIYICNVSNRQLNKHISKQFNVQFSPEDMIGLVNGTVFPRSKGGFALLVFIVILVVAIKCHRMRMQRRQHHYGLSNHRPAPTTRVTNEYASLGSRHPAGTTDTPLMRNELPVWDEPPSYAEVSNNSNTGYENIEMDHIYLPPPRLDRR